MHQYGQRRLTSWKEIAAYMDRDVRTVMRWEKTRGLPITRGAGGKSGVVFADTGELDAWARGDDIAPAPTAPAATAQAATAPAPDWPLPRERAAPWRRGAIALTVILTVAVGVAGWWLRPALAARPAVTLTMTADAVVALNADGSERWRHVFAGEIGVPFARTNTPFESMGEGEGTLTGTSQIVRKDDLSIRSGQVLWFDPRGTVRQSFSFADRLTIGSRSFSAPWMIIDYQLRGSAGARRLAVTAHHYEWWPSIVTILDESWRRQGSFVNAGWVEYVRWLPDGRLAIAGFSNAKDGGMVALLDSGAFDGQSPPTADAEFACAACGPDRPLRYVVMPRSEVNRVSAAPFNRASLSVRDEGIMVRTVELPSANSGSPADAVYEFDSQLQVVHASYGDRYWEAHRELERVGKITHTREQCPDRDGPPRIEVWDAAAGWRVQRLPRLGPTP